MNFYDEIDFMKKWMDIPYGNQTDVWKMKKNLLTNLQNNTYFCTYESTKKK